MTEAIRTRTAVGIVGGGPAGLMLSHLLSAAGVDSVVVDNRSRREIEQTVRAGILEADSVRLLVDTGVSDRVLREGHAHDGIVLRFDGLDHRIDFQGLVGSPHGCTRRPTSSSTSPPRATGMARTSASASATLRSRTSRVRARGSASPTPTASARSWSCDYLVGADGSRSTCRHEIPEAQRRQFSREYPFAWFGILCEAPPSAPELVYTHSERGFALISQRTETLQRLYFQCSPEEDPDTWSEDRIWDELQSRVEGADGFTLKEGPVTDRTVLRFRSFVCEPMRYGNMLLAGDAAHTVPPTGAKGLNLALADVTVLAEVLARAIGRGDADALDEYSPRAQARVWKAQHFSYWMTSMLHTVPGATDFDRRRQLGELAMVVGSEAGSRYLAEAYTGWPAAAS